MASMVFIYLAQNEYTHKQNIIGEKMMIVTKT